ncbi:MAG: hypothetical protein ACI837_003113 [Crocinitomicaceae bacterium]|jgi:hypothetical protein
MQNWVTVLRVELPMDAYLTRSQLEFENIEVQILDVLSIEAVPFYSGAMGGIRIQVRENQVNDAIAVLKALNKITDVKKKRNRVIEVLDSISAKIPIIKNLRIEARILVLISFVLLIIIIPLAYKPGLTLTDKLITGQWCVSRVTLNGKELTLEKRDVLLYLNDCSDFLSFNTNGTLQLPDYDNVARIKSWNEYMDGIYLHSDHRSDNSNKIHAFEGKYEVILEGQRLELRSDSVFIQCYDYSF